MKIVVYSRDTRTSKLIREQFPREDVEDGLPEKIIGSEKNSEASVVIVDRIDLELKSIKFFFPRAEVFVIVDSWPDLPQAEDFQLFKCCRFYSFPVDWQIFFDDIRALSKIHEYMEFGLVPAHNFYIDLNSHSITDGSKSVLLRRKEYELILYLARNRGKLVSRERLLEEVWDFNSMLKTNTVDVHVSRIRKIIRDNFGVDKVIITVPCAGYMIS